MAAVAEERHPGVECRTCGQQVDACPSCRTPLVHRTQWTRDLAARYPAILGSTRLYAADLDLAALTALTYRATPAILLCAETKQRGMLPPPQQLELLAVEDAWLRAGSYLLPDLPTLRGRRRVVYAGTYVVIFERRDPGDSSWVDIYRVDGLRRLTHLRRFHLPTEEELFARWLASGGLEYPTPTVIPLVNGHYRGEQLSFNALREEAA